MADRALLQQVLDALTVLGMNYAIERAHGIGTTGGGNG